MAAAVPPAAPIVTPTGSTTPTEAVISSEEVVGGDYEEARIRVAVRLRPYNEKEKLACPEDQQQIWLINDDRTIVENSQVVLDASNFFSQKEFLFDHVFGPESENHEIYEGLVLPIVTRFVAGFNGTVFAYGQTSSGKTHTLIGTPKDPGTLPLAIHDVFDLMAKADGDNKAVQFLLRVSYMEIYNDQLTDLLDEEEAEEFVTKFDSTTRRSMTMSPFGTERLRIRETPKTGWFVEGLKEFLVKSPEEALAYMASGERRKHIAETEMNQRSSRSHTIFRLTLESKRGGGPTVVSILNLVDLGGNESVKKAGTSSHDERIKEGAQINRSLLLLGNVIQKLSEVDHHQSHQHHHIPYRDSSLTKVLANSLGGNANTAVVATLSPAPFNLSESRNTLLFASRAAKIVNRTEKVLLTDGSTIEKYKREIELLRKKLAEMKGDGEREQDAERRLKQVQDLIRMSTHRDLDGGLVLEGLLAVTSGRRTLAEVADDLGIDKEQLDTSTSNGSSSSFSSSLSPPSSTARRSSGNHTLRRPLRRRMSSLELEKLVRLSDMHQKQVRTELGPDAAVVMEPDVPLSRRLWTPAAITEEDQEVMLMSTLRSATTAFSPRVLERVLTSPNLMQQVLSNNGSIMDTQEQDGGGNWKDGAPACGGQGRAGAREASVDAKGASSSSLRHKRPRRRVHGNDLYKKPSQGTGAVEVSERVKNGCREADQAWEKVMGAFSSLVQQPVNGEAKAHVSVALQDLKSMERMLHMLGKIVRRTNEDATCLMTQVLNLSYQASVRQASCCPCQTQGPAARMREVTTKDKHRRWLYNDPKLVCHDDHGKARNMTRHPHEQLQKPVAAEVQPSEGVEEQEEANDREDGGGDLELAGRTSLVVSPTTELIHL